MKSANKIDESTRLSLGPGIRLKHDAGRGAWTLMAPERVIMLDEIAYEVINEVAGSDGRLGGVIDRLSARFDAPRDEIGADVLELLQGFVDKQLLRRK